MTERIEYWVQARRPDGVIFYAREAVSPETLAILRPFGGEIGWLETRIFFPGLVADILALDTPEHGRVGDEATWSGSWAVAHLAEPEDDAR